MLVFIFLLHWVNCCYSIKLIPIRFSQEGIKYGVALFAFIPSYLALYVAYNNKGWRFWHLPLCFCWVYAFKCSEIGFMLAGGLPVESSVESRMKSQGLHSYETTPSFLWWSLTSSWLAMMICLECIKVGFVCICKFVALNAWIVA